MVFSMVGNLSKVFNRTALEKAFAFSVSIGVTFACLTAGNLFYDLFNGKSFEDAKKSNIATQIGMLAKKECYDPIQRRFTPEIEGTEFAAITKITPEGKMESKQYYAKDDREEISEEIAARDYSWISRVYRTKTYNGIESKFDVGTSFFIESPFPLPENTALLATAAHITENEKDLSKFDFEYKYIDKNGDIKREELKAVHKWLNPGYKDKKNDPRNDPYDMALLLIKVPDGVVIDKAVPVLDQDIYASDEIKTVNSLGFPYDKKGLTAHFKAKTQASSNTNIINSFCDIASGQSGGPLTFGRDVKKAVGINVSISSLRTTHSLLKNSILTSPKGFAAWIEKYKSKKNQNNQPHDKKTIANGNGVGELLFPQS